MEKQEVQGTVFIITLVTGAAVLWPMEGWHFAILVAGAVLAAACWE